MTYIIYQQKQNSGGFLFLWLETFSHRAFQKITNPVTNKIEKTVNQKIGVLTLHEFMFILKVLPQLILIHNIHINCQRFVSFSVPRTSSVKTI